MSIYQQFLFVDMLLLLQGRCRCRCRISTVFVCGYIYTYKPYVNSFYLNVGLLEVDVEANKNEADIEEQGKEAANDQKHLCANVFMLIFFADIYANVSMLIFFADMLIKG